jgi:hypothetical protein
MGAKQRMTRGGARIPLRSALNKYLRHITVADALEMYANREVFLHTKGRGANEEITGAKLRDLLREAQEDSASITAAEMELNAETLDASFTASMTEMQKRERQTMEKVTEDGIESAHDKVAAWPTVGDTKAIRVGVRA